jgi:hypothetical protein
MWNQIGARKNHILARFIITWIWEKPLVFSLYYILSSALHAATTKLYFSEASQMKLYQVMNLANLEVHKFFILPLNQELFKTNFSPLKRVFL